MSVEEQHREQEFWEELEREPIRVELYSRADHKHAIDDMIQRLLTRLHLFEEDMSSSNLKLLLGYLACIIALGGCAVAYFMPFQETRLMLGVCAALYFLLSGAMSLHAYFEGSRFFVGTRVYGQAQERVVVSSDLSNSTYMLCLQIEQPAGSPPFTASAAFDIGTLFDKTGLLLGTAVNDQLRKLLLRGQRSKKDN